MWEAVVHDLKSAARGGRFAVDSIDGLMVVAGILRQVEDLALQFVGQQFFERNALAPLQTARARALREGPFHNPGGVPEGPAGGVEAADVHHAAGVLGKG